MDPRSDPESAPLTQNPLTVAKTSRSSRRTCVLAAASTVALLLLVIALLTSAGQRTRKEPPRIVSDAVPLSRGVSDGVSEKSTAAFLVSEGSYPWTNAMLAWQRTGFHFQPPKNWMNDPNGLMYYKGWYHLFYQYNPDSAVWGNITWGHAVSRDLIHWRHLPLAMVRDHWYDGHGVFSGSATVLPDGRIVVIYTGSANDLSQIQNIAVPADLADPLLISWVKSDANPILYPPPGIGIKDFRDPTSFWSVDRPGSEPVWRVAIGSKNDYKDHTGIVLVYDTKDFINYDLLSDVMHEVPGTGMWECVDFYPVSTGPEFVGLDNSARPGAGVKHVLKASLDDDKHDYYAIGEYDVEANVWVPDDPENDVGIGLRVDYGKYYASKTFYDAVKKRRVLIGWSGETDSERTDLLKGWASLQTIPREVSFDKQTGRNILQWPIEEVESLRLESQEFSDVTLDVGLVLPLQVQEAVQLDIEAEFEVDPLALANTVEADIGYNCSTSGGAAGRSALGPFGLLVLADDDRTEQTAVYFYVGRGTDGGLRTFFCQDELRSTKANDVIKRVYGSTVPVLDGENLTVRILVDHSVVESFAQGGRTCITSRVYPTRAIYDAARIFLFNNATGAQVTAKSVKIWRMNSAFIRPYNAETDA